jgi:hypothetical protein
LDPVRSLTPGIQPGLLRPDLHDPAFSGTIDAEPSGIRIEAGYAGPGFQHSSQLHDEHKLAILRGRDIPEANANFIAFSAFTRMSGVDFAGRRLCKGATDAICKYVRENGGQVAPEVQEMSDRVARIGGTPLAVADGKRLLGVIHLKDIVKGGIKERISQLRCMGIRTVMITGDNPLTAAAITAEAGVDDFIAQATPKAKLDYIKKEQAAGRLVAMTGDDTRMSRLIAQSIEAPTLGFLGDARVNVLKLNLALNRHFPSSGASVAGL